MISLVICSVNVTLLDQLKQNIAETAGVDVEFLVWDNKDNKGLCTVYNQMAAKAQYEIVSFLHEDVLFKTKDWGKQLLHFFEEHSDYGMAGFAGSKFKSISPSGWYTGIKEFDCANVVQRMKSGDLQMLLKPNQNVSFEEVVTLDGFFMAVRKSLWHDVLFDEKNLSGFHFYDIDFSLRLAKRAKLAVLYSIDIIHINEGGSFKDEWVETAIRYHRLYQDKLPVSCIDVSGNDIERKISFVWYDVLKHYPISLANKMGWIKAQDCGVFSMLYQKIKFLLYLPLKLNKIHNLLR